MITINGEKLNTTIFPDGTSQVWKLSSNIMDSRYVFIDWRFESEAEFLHLFQLRELLPYIDMTLHMPYMPYARQDKGVDNNATFALQTFCALINLLRFKVVTAVDVHNLDRTQDLLKNFQNISPRNIHSRLIRDLKPDFIVFPDLGAYTRYQPMECNALVFHKVRDQATGNIKGIKCNEIEKIKFHGSKYLIIDDICDGGATFLGVRDAIMRVDASPKISLFVTHGLWSKGRKVLEDAGLKLYTTDSLPRNPDGFIV